MCLQPAFIQLPPIHASSCLPSRQILTSLVTISHSNALCWWLHRHTCVLYQSYASLNLVKLIIKTNHHTNCLDLTDRIISRTLFTSIPIVIELCQVIHLYLWNNFGIIQISALSNYVLLYKNVI